MNTHTKEIKSDATSVPPTCVGIIMDGNRRWAREQGLPTMEGHRRGSEKLKEVAKWCKEYGIQHLAVYAFSTENWNRSKEEVAYLMDLARELFQTKLPEIRKENTAVHVVGDVTRFPEDLQSSIQEIHDTNPDSPTHHLWVAASYGGRAEIVGAVNHLLASGEQYIDEDSFSKALWTADMPEPDIIIRTGGEHRLSNFLTWKSVYSELFFVNTHWPAFTKEEFEAILEQYADRERRHGR